MARPFNASLMFSEFFFQNERRNREEQYRFVIISRKKIITLYHLNKYLALRHVVSNYKITYLDFFFSQFAEFRSLLILIMMSYTNEWIFKNWIFHLSTSTTHSCTPYKEKSNTTVEWLCTSWNFIGEVMFGGFREKVPFCNEGQAILWKINDKRNEKGFSLIISPQRWTWCQ